MQKKIKVSILFVYYKEKKELFSCLNSIKEAKIRFSYEIIVVDNSGTNLLEKKLNKKYPKVKYVKAPNNLGFGRGANLAAKHATGEYLFTLNPDTKILPGTMEKLVNFAEKKKGKVAVAPMLVDEKLNKVPRLGTNELTPLRAIFALSIINKIYPNNPISKSYWLETSEQKSTYKADIIPGIFLIGKSIFRKLNGFDKNFFLYFEDTDFFVRLKKKGYKAFILQDAQIVHIGSAATSKQIGTGKIASQSRYYYFKKHYGMVAALSVEMFARFSKWHAALFGILALSAFLLFFQINNLMMFIGDFAWIYLQARDMLLTGEIPLVGIASSVPVFKQGALYTWMLAGSLKLGNFNPVAGAYLSSIIGLFSVWFTYKVVNMFFDKKVALISALIAATSPLMVIHARIPFETAPVYFVTLLTAWSAYKITLNKKPHYFFLGLWLALLYQLELAAFVLIPVVILALIWQKVIFRGRDIYCFIFGGFLGISPFIIWDLKQGVYLQTLGFTAWVFTKIWEGINGLAANGIVAGSYSAGLEYLVRFIYPASAVFSYGVVIFALGFFLIFIIRNLRSLKFGYKFIFLWLVFALSGFILRGIVSEAYTPFLFFPLLALLALSFQWLIEKVGRVFWLLILALALVNSFFLIQSNYLLPKIYGLPYSERVRIADAIIKDASGRDYRFIYKGPGAYFEATDDNYQYLLWWKGNAPEENASIAYTLFEPAEKFSGVFDDVIDFGHTKVGVNYD